MKYCVMFLLILVFLSFSVHASDADCIKKAERAFSRVLGQKDFVLEGQENQESWNQFPFTNPKNHTAESFTYLVHGVDLNSGTRRRTKVPRAISSDPLRAFQRRRLFSASLINQDWPFVLYRIGYILEVPGQSIIATSPRDFGSRLSDNLENDIWDFNAYYPILPPEKLISLSQNEEYGADNFSHLRNTLYPHNEVIVLANSGIKIVGGFIAIPPVFSEITLDEQIRHLKIRNKDRVQEILRFLRQNRLPLVRIDIPSRL